MASTIDFTTFHLFPNLPFDLRIYIWSFICPELGHQQVLEFVFTLRPSPNPVLEQHHALAPAHCSLANNTAAIRLLLSICPESRALALRQWPDTLEFAPAWKPKRPSPRAERWMHQLADEHDADPVGGVVRFDKERDMVFLVPWHHHRGAWMTRCTPSYLYAWDPMEFCKEEESGDQEDDCEEDGREDDDGEDDVVDTGEGTLEESGKRGTGDADQSSELSIQPPRREPRAEPLAVFDLAGFAEQVRLLVVHISTCGPLDYMYAKANHQPWHALFGQFRNLKRLYLPFRASKSRDELARPNWRIFVSSAVVEVWRSDPDRFSFSASSWPRSYDALRRGMGEECARLESLGVGKKKGSEHLPRLGKEYKEWVMTKVPHELLESGKKGDGRGCQVLPVVLWRGLHHVKLLQEAEFEVVDDDGSDGAWWLADRGGCPAGIFE